MKKEILLSSVAIIGITGIISAYISTYTPKEIENNVSDERQSIEIYNPVITSEPENTAEPIYYMLIGEGKKLNLYEINGNVKKIVKSAEITPEIFPEDDIELLKNGIHALSLEEGVEIMENFIS